jgi:HEPN/RES N-terminal domain 1/RES domain
VGGAKRLWEEEQERGWRSTGKYICVECVHEPALKRIVEENGIEATCDYCGREGSDELAVCDSDAVMETIGESLHFEYGHPIEELPWDEGEYVGRHFDTDDLLEELGEDIGDEEFEADVVAAFGDAAWCERDYFMTKEDDSLAFSWERFAEVVKYERRYLFLKLDMPDEDAEAYDVTPAEILTRIGELIARHGLVRTLPAETVVYRGRSHAAAEGFTTAADLGTPPREAAMSNRMSPAGIAVFYGALDRETAIAEIAPSISNEKPTMSLGEFATADEMQVVDLAVLPEIPSIFDEDARTDRPTLRFLRQFAGIVSQSAAGDRAADREIIDYIPTQVVTEYLWHAFDEEHDAGRIDGILYRSAQHDGGTCCALFVPRDNCVEPDADRGDSDLPAVTLRQVELVPVSRLTRLV